MLLSLLIKLPLFRALSINDSCILISDSTPSDLQLFFPSQHKMNLENISLENAVESLSSKNFLFLIDLTFKRTFTHMINTLSSTLEVSYLSLFEVDSTSKNRQEVHISSIQEFNQIMSLFHHLNIDSFTVLSSASHSDSKLSQKFESIPKVKIFYYSDQITEKAAESLVVKILKTQGLKYVLIIDSSPSFQIIESTIKKKHWDKPGVVLVYSSKCISYSRVLGTLQVTEEGTEDSRSESEFHYKAILNLVKIIDSKLKNIEDENKISRMNIFQVMKNLTFPSVKLVNFKPESEIVGTFDISNSLLTVHSTILFPGNTFSLTLNPRSTIKLSMANGTNEPYYFTTISYIGLLYQGANYAVSLINKKNEIPNFDLQLNPTDCGIFWYEPNWYSSCFAPLISDFGIGFITTIFGESLKGNIFTLRSLNKVVPHVSPLGGSIETDNKSVYPELVKLEATFEIFTSSMIVTLMSLGYRDIIFIASNDTAVFQRYKNYKNIIEKNGMKIVNDEESRFLNWLYHRDNFTLYEEMFKRIKKTRCTLVFIDINDPAMALEALYDVGYRTGEILYFGYSLILNFLENINEPYRSKRIEMVSGSLIFAYREYVGMYGLEIKKALLQISSEVGYMCMTFDTVSVFKEAINYLLAIGSDFEDYQQLIKSIRMNRFVGCVGNVFFDSDGNTRSSAQVLIQQVHYNLTVEKLLSTDIAFYDRFSTVLYNQFHEYDWPTGSMPLNFIPVVECFSDSKNDHESDEGKKILYYLSMGLFITTLLSGFFSILKNRSSFQELKEKSVISFEDMICYSFFFLEFLQLVAMGPDQDVYKEITNNINLLFSFDWDQYFSFEHEKFWRMFYSILTLCILWVIISVIKLTHADFCFPESIRSRFTSLLNLYLYLIGHLLFLPCTSMILNVYSCYRATGSALEDTYLKQDCRKHCYKGNHKDFAILSYVVLTFFLALVVYTRPKLQDFFSFLHIKTKPFFLIIETFLHVALVILNKTLKRENQITHGIVMCIVLSLFLGFTYFYKPYNFKRPFICHCGFIIASIWAILTSVIFHRMDQLRVWIIVEMIGLIIIFILMLIVIKKYPEILYSEKGTEISSLFIFQFCRDYEKRLKSLEDLDFLAENKYAIPESSR